MSLDEKKQITIWLAFTGALAVLMIIGFYLAKPYIESRRSVQMHLIARDIISEHISSASENRAVLEMATRYKVLDKGNELLAACLGKDDKHGPCTITSPEQQVQFLLKDSIYESANLLAGTKETPGVFDLSGKNGCDQEAAKDCPGWLAYIWFWAECPEKANSCDKAERIWIRHQVVAGVPNKSLPSYPPNIQFSNNPKSFAKSVRLQTP